MLTIHDFRSRLVNMITPGTVLKNPGGGTTRIRAYSDRNVSYVRGNSTISVRIMDLFDAYTKFRGKQVSSRHLKEYKPEVFDSSARPAGHSCNCTFLFMVLTQLELAGGISGRGKTGQPFSTTFYDEHNGQEIEA